MTLESPHEMADQMRLRIRRFGCPPDYQLSEKSNTLHQDFVAAREAQRTIGLSVALPGESLKRH